MAEIEEFNAMVANDRSARDARAVVERLLEWMEEGRFHWSNNDLFRFLQGLSGAISEFEEVKGIQHYDDLLAQGPWRLVAEVVSNALVVD